MKAKLPLNLDELKVTTFETAETPPAPSGENVRTCLNTGCPPYNCCV